MNRYIVRQPVKDAEDNIIGYEILYDNSHDVLNHQGVSDYAVADAIYNFLNDNSDKLFKDSVSFMTFTPTLLFKNTPKLFDRKRLVVQIEDNVIVHPMATRIVQRYQSEGYQIAVNDFQFNTRYFSMMDYVDYIKLNISGNTEAWLENMVQMAHSMHKKCVATGIDSKELYDLAHRVGADYFQGSYVAGRVKTKVHKANYLQSNFFQLVVEVTKDEPDIDQIEGLISRDASLTYALLRMANSVYYASRTHASSVRQALVTVGLGQMKQWVYLMSCSQQGEDLEDSEEFLRLSFLRANFCAELAGYSKVLQISKSEAYLLGMFSTLNYLIDVPLEESLSEIPIADEVKQALLKREGTAGILYSLVLTYEKADWTTMTGLAAQLQIPTEVLTTVYFDCVETVNSIWDSLTNRHEEDETKA